MQACAGGGHKVHLGVRADPRVRAPPVYDQALRRHAYGAAQLCCAAVVRRAGALRVWLAAARLQRALHPHRRRASPVRWSFHLGALRLPAPVGYPGDVLVLWQAQLAHVERGLPQRAPRLPLRAMVTSSGAAPRRARVLRRPRRLRLVDRRHLRLHYAPRGWAVQPREAQGAKERVNRAQADTCGIVLLATLQKSTFRPFLLGRTGIRGQNELFEGERENCSRLFSPGDGGVRDRFGSAGLIVVKPFVALSDLAR
mmetsp:Transcript_29329/g.64253  ORF Transcript_29329/g.64253 Transcript_29329/m.64253 type:complete len:255 (+) Transcript_29329:520-1284(+)